MEEYDVSGKPKVYKGLSEEILAALPDD